MIFNHFFDLIFRPELDACDSPEKYPQLFHIIVEIEVDSTDRQTDLTPPWENFTTKDINPSILFSSHQEHQDTLALAGKEDICFIWGNNPQPGAHIDDEFHFIKSPVSMAKDWRFQLS